MASKTTRMQDTTIAKFDDIKKIFGVETNDDMMNGLIALIPLHIAMVEKGLTIEQAIEKLNAVETKTEVRIIKKGINEFAFNDWKEKLFAYNEKASNEDKVIITQNLFLDLIGGNVNTISKLYKANEDEIKAHNAKLGLEDNHNRKLSSRIREQHGSVANWVKAQLA